MKVIVFYIYVFFLSITTLTAQSLNCKDSKGRKIGTWIECDVEGVKYIKLTYSHPDIIDHVCYFSRSKMIISSYTYEIDYNVLKGIQKDVESKFIVNDINEGTGTALLLLIIDPAHKVYEIRLVNDLGSNFNKEMIRVIKEVELKLKFLIPKIKGKPIVTVLPIKIYP